MTTIERELDPPRIGQTFRGYKWLSRGAVDPDTSSAWEWSEPDPCYEDERPGMVFATSIHGLPYRIDDELWEVELTDVLGATPFPEQASYGWPEIFAEYEQRILARGGRLLRRINVWTPEVARAFAMDCARVARDRALNALHDADRALWAEGDAKEPPIPSTHADAAERELLLLEHVENQVAIWREALSADAFGISHPADAYAAAAAAARAAAAAVSSRAPAILSPDGALGAEHAYAEERRRQARWLRERLGLPSPGYEEELARVSWPQT